jgi:hypothetical protein
VTWVGRWRARPDDLPKGNSEAGAVAIRHNGHRLRRAAAACALMLMALALVVGTPAPTLAQEQAIPVMLQTVPPMSDIEISVGGKRTRTDARGLALLTVDKPGSYKVSIRSLSADTTARVSFARWSDGVTTLERVMEVSSFTFLQAGFLVTRRVDSRFLNDSGRPIDSPIDSFTIEDNTGRVLRLDGDTSSWVPTNRLVLASDELTSQPVGWRVAQVVVDGMTMDATGEEELSAGDGLWSIRLDLDPAAGDVAAQEETESGESSDSTLYPFVMVTILIAGAMFMIAARRGGVDLRARLSVVLPRWPRLSAVLKTRPGIRGVAAPLASVATTLRRRLHRDSTRPTTELLRLRLKNGQTIEGWTGPHIFEDGEALRLISVTQVLDKEGQPVTSKPSDAFVPRSRIATLEILMTSKDGPIVHRGDEVGEGARVIDLREQRRTQAK